MTATDGGEPSYKDLSDRLAVAEANLQAIRRGEVDALVVDVEGGARVFTLEGADAFYRTLVEQMPEGAAVIDRAGRVVYANPCLADLVGVPLGQLLSTDLTAYFPPRGRAAARRRLLGATPVAGVDATLVRPDGREVPVALSVSPVDGSVDEARCVIAVDLTTVLDREAAVRAAEARFKNAFDHAPIGMALLDRDGRVEQVNDALCDIADATSAALVGAPLPWQATGDGDALTAALDRLRRGETDEALVERRNERADGRMVWVAIQIRMLPSVPGGEPRFIVQVRDESARRLHEAELRHVADHDGLTGLLNRRAFEEALAHHLELGRRYGVDGAVVLIDVDHFKYVNDTHGHQAGDALLIELADAFQARLRASDVVGRLGGDEFAVLAPHGGPDEALILAEHLLQAARDVDTVVRGTSRPMTISVGVAAITNPTPTPGELMAAADLAMYDAKEAGRDRACLYQETPDAPSGTAGRLTWLSRIEAAIVGGDLLLDAQPIVDLATGETVQEELLARLPGQGGRIAAGLWFPVAERYGLAPAIDEWVVDRAFDLLAADPSRCFNVNVSPTTVGRASWRARVGAGLARTGVPAERITFEITETTAISNMAAAVRFTADLRSIGCRLALDDFGAGFGSFYYLKHLPLDDVKIDGEFVRDSVRDERDRTIIRAMVDVATSMGRRTVAECIEDAATLDLVRTHRVDLAQGYHLSPPQPVELP